MLQSPADPELASPTPASAALKAEFPRGTSGEAATTSEDASDGPATTASKAPWRSHLPIVGYLSTYSRTQARKDMRAGLNVALLDFPQGMAYAMIAGLPVQSGLYASALGSITGPLFASSRFLMLGPTNATAILLLSSLATLNLPETQRLAALPLLVLMVATLFLVGALLNAGVIIRYISRSVITGYVTAGACLIVGNQIKHVLGLEIAGNGVLWRTLDQTARALPATDLVSLAIAASTLGLYYTLRRIARDWPHVALTLALVSIGAFLLQRILRLGIASLPALPAASWPLSWPAFDFEIFSQLASPAFAIAFLSLLESASIAKALAARSGDTVDVRQQMVSVGVANVACAFGSGMPVSGSLTRSMLNWSSGARTPVSSIVSGVLIVLGVLALGPLIGFVPRAALAALVIAVGLSLIDPAAIRVIMRTTRADAATFLVTAISGLLFPLDTAIFFGVVTSLLFFLHKVAQPRLVEHAFNDGGELVEKGAGASRTIPTVSIVHVEGDLFFGAADVFLEQMRLLVRSGNLKVVLLRMRNAHNLDATSALAIGELVRFAREHGCEVLVSELQPEAETILRRASLHALIGENHIFRHVPDQPGRATRDALKRVQQITGHDDAQIILFAPPKAAAPASP